MAFWVYCDINLKLTKQKICCNNSEFVIGCSMSCTRYSYLEACSVFLYYDKQLYRHFWDLNRKLLPWKKTKKKISWKEFVDSGIVKTCDELDLRLSFQQGMSAGHVFLFIYWSLCTSSSGWCVGIIDWDLRFLLNHE